MQLPRSLLPGASLRPTSAAHFDFELPVGQLGSAHPNTECVLSELLQARQSIGVSFDVGSVSSSPVLHDFKKDVVRGGIL